MCPVHALAVRDALLAKAELLAAAGAKGTYNESQKMNSIIRSNL